MEERSIKKRIALSGSREVVLVDSNSSEKCDLSRNLFCLSETGTVLWQVQSGVASHGVDSYSDVYIGENGELFAYSANGIEYTIDEYSGDILSRELIR